MQAHVQKLVLMAMSFDKRIPHSDTVAKAAATLIRVPLSSVASLRSALSLAVSACSALTSSIGYLFSSLIFRVEV